MGAERRDVDTTVKNERMKIIFIKHSLSGKKNGFVCAVLTLLLKIDIAPYLSRFIQMVSCFFKNFLCLI